MIPMEYSQYFCASFISMVTTPGNWSLTLPWCVNSIRLLPHLLINICRESDDYEKDDMTDAEIAKIVVVHPTPPTFKKHPQVCPVTIIWHVDSRCIYAIAPTLDIEILLAIWLSISIGTLERRCALRAMSLQLLRHAFGYTAVGRLTGIVEQLRADFIYL